MRGSPEKGYYGTTGPANNLTKRVEEHARMLFSECRGGGCAWYDDLVPTGQRKWRRCAALDMMAKGIYK